METLIMIAVVAAVFALIYYGFPKKVDVSAMENDAKRFAYLLISDIKLFETYKVSRGLQNNNLKESCGIEIEAARKKYKKRFPQNDFEIFFEEKLIEVLADGDESKL